VTVISTPAVLSAELSAELEGCLPSAYFSSRYSPNQNIMSNNRQKRSKV